MSRIVIHIGAPRTGTTVLQKNILPKCKHHLVFMKRAFSSSGKTVSQDKTFLIGAPPEELIESLSGTDPKNDPINFFNDFIATPAILGSRNQSLSRNNRLYSLILEKAILKVSKASTDTDKSILISSERLMDTGASLVCKTSHDQASDCNFGYKIICKAISQSLKIEPLIIACLREPIGYLRSKYLRTFVQRRAMKSHRDLSPSEYIKKQVILESSNPGTSALAPAMHAEFIKQIQRHAFVKAFGFQELIESEDVFSLMGLKGEEAYAFRDFPRENKLPVTKEQEQAIEIKITQALKQYGFYDRIMKAQMFE